MKTKTVECQWCGSTDIYVSGHSAVCVETEHKCKNCGERTWHDIRKDSRGRN